MLGHSCTTLTLTRQPLRVWGKLMSHRSCLLAGFGCCCFYFQLFRFQSFSLRNFLKTLKFPCVSFPYWKPAFYQGHVSVWAGCMVLMRGVNVCLNNDSLSFFSWSHVQCVMCTTYFAVLIALAWMYSVHTYKCVNKVRNKQKASYFISLFNLWLWSKIQTNSSATLRAGSGHQHHFWVIVQNLSQGRCRTTAFLQQHCDRVSKPWKGSAFFLNERSQASAHTEHRPCVNSTRANSSGASFYYFSFKNKVGVSC